MEVLIVQAAVKWPSLWGVKRAVGKTTPVSAAQSQTWTAPTIVEGQAVQDDGGCCEQADRDCAGDCFGVAQPDGCGTCDDNPDNDCCGGPTNIACDGNQECVDNPNDDCDPLNGGIDCPGICQNGNNNCAVGENEDANGACCTPDRLDCNNICDGGAQVDGCGTCDNDPGNDCCGGPNFVDCAPGLECVDDPK